MDPFPPSLPNYSYTNPNSASSHNPIVMRPTTSSAPTSDNDNHSLATASTGTHNQASEFATQSFQNIRIDSSILEKDPIICCPICKEEFFLDLEVKMLPCKHMYHTECILQWLKIKNSCPVCRFQLPPVEDDESVIPALPAFSNDENLVETLVAEELFDDDDFLDLVPSIRRVSRSYDFSAMYHSVLQTDDFLHRLRYQLFRTVETRNFPMMRRQLIENEGPLVLPTRSGEFDHGVEVVESSNSRESLDDEGIL